MSSEVQKQEMLAGLSAIWDRAESGEVLSLLIIEEQQEMFLLRMPTKIENVRALGMLDLGASIIRNSMEHGP